MMGVREIVFKSGARLRLIYDKARHRFIGSPKHIGVTYVYPDGSTVHDTELEWRRRNESTDARKRK